MIEIQPLLGLRMLNDGSLSLVSTRQGNKHNVATISWQTPLSQSPPLLGLAVAPSALTCHHIKQTGEFILNFPDLSLLAEVHYCGTHSGRHSDKIRTMQLQTIASRRVAPLLVSNCIAHLECVLREWYPLGDHCFFVGEVLTALVEEEYFDQHWSETSQTLHHLGGDLYSTAGVRVSARDFPLPEQDPSAAFDLFP